MIYYHCEPQYADSIVSLLSFWGLKGSYLDLVRIGKISLSRDQDVCLLLKPTGNDRLKIILGLFGKVIDLTGELANITECPLFKISGALSVCFNSQAFQHRLRNEFVVGEDNEEISVFTDVSKSEILIGAPQNMYGLLIFRMLPGDRKVILSSIDLTDPERSFSIFCKELVDIIWVSLEVVLSTKLAHHQWCCKFALRIDDVIGDCSYDLIEPLDDLSQSCLMAVDLRKMKPRFFDMYLPRCGEICVHALTHYKYLGNDQTSLVYMNWDSVEELSYAELQENFVKYDSFMERVPRTKRSSVLSAHGFQVGKNAVQFLSKRGIRFIVSPFLLGEPFTSGVHQEFTTFPYGSPGYHLTEYNGVSLFFHAELSGVESRWGTPSSFALTVEASSRTDFLYGLPLYSKTENIYLNPIESIIERINALRQEAYILGFPFILFTHETQLRYLGCQGWQEVCKYLKDNISSNYEAVSPSRILDDMQHQLYKEDNR